jgi:hypothetical protein
MSPIRSPRIAHAAATAGFTFTTTTAPVDAVVDPQPTTTDLPPLYPNPPSPSLWTSCVNGVVPVAARAPHYSSEDGMELQLLVHEAT